MAGPASLRGLCGLHNLGACVHPGGQIRKLNEHLIFSPTKICLPLIVLFSQRTYRMFRTLGLRHLCVINKHNQVLGIVTRADLVAAHLLKNSRLGPIDLGDSSFPTIASMAKRRIGFQYLQHTISLDLKESM